MPSFNCSAILFDLDGVLVDSTRSVARQWRRWAEERGIDPEKLLAFAHGVRAVEVIAQVAPHLDAEDEVKKLEKQEADDTEGVAVMPGARELIASLPEGRWGVVTSGTRHLAIARLRLANISVSRALVTSDDVEKGKPDPAPYLKGAELLGVNPADCLVIEDAPAGIRAAHAGGMKVIALSSTFPVSDLVEADAVVEALSQIRVSVPGSAENLEIRIE
jgi:sugar-phosphatase